MLVYLSLWLQCLCMLTGNQVPAHQQLNVCFKIRSLRQLWHSICGINPLACLQAYDELRNKRLSGGDNFMAHLVGPAGVITHASLEDKEDGTYLVTYCCTAAGMHDLHVTIGKTAGVAPQAPSGPPPPPPPPKNIRGSVSKAQEFVFVLPSAAACQLTFLNISIMFKRLILVPRHRQL